MITFPNAKINLGLDILRKRPDGYHDIASVFYPLGWHDALEAVPSEGFSFTSSGLAIPGEAQDNLCVKAYTLFSEKYGCPAVHLHLHKAIPMGAGLGGGSSDATAALALLNQLGGHKLGHGALKEMAALLGSDCAFFVENRPMLATGRGEVLAPVPLSLKGMHVALVCPGVHVPTPRAYSLVVPQEPAMPVEEIVRLPVTAWKGRLENRFEAPVTAAYPELAGIKERLYGAGAAYASMTGSGSAFYGLFSSVPPDVRSLFPACTCWTGELG